MVLEHDLDYYIKKRLKDIFADDGNPLPEIAFIAGLPESWFWLVTAAAWDAMTD